MMPPEYQQLVSDLLVLAAVVAAVLSVILTIVALTRTRAPRGGAIALVVAILAVSLGAFCSTQPVGPDFVASAWSRVISQKEAPGPAPLPDTPAEGESAGDEAAATPAP